MVPRLPKASDLRPFPTAKCIEYKTPHDAGAAPPIIRCLASNPTGQYMASGASDGVVRLWEVQSGRLLESWDLSAAVSKLGGHKDDDTAAGSTGPKPIVCLDWNPNRSHHCLLAAVGNYVVVVATGTAGRNDAEISDALLAAALSGGGVTNEKAKKAIQWLELKPPPASDRRVSAFDKWMGPVCALRTPAEVSSVRWQAKGDYFLSVSPKAGAAAVLIHQLSKGNSQQPFSKAKGEAQVACFHPNKPFLYVTIEC